MDISASTEKWLGGIAAVGAGILAWEKEATGKYAAAYKASGVNYPMFSTWRFADALSGIIGNNLTDQIFRNAQGGIIRSGIGQGFKPNPMGWANKTVALGVGIKIADEVLKRIWPMYEKDLDAVPEVIRGLSTGLIAGGAVGGIFDPAVGGYTMVGGDGGMSGPMAIGNVPFGRGEATQGRQTSVLV
jgi:hypothetical protein